MADPTDTPRALLTIAAETFREEILADLPKDKRYAGAMTANALAIAERMLAAGDPMQALCEALGNASGGNAEDLGTSHPEPQDYGRQSSGSPDVATPGVDRRVATDQSTLSRQSRRVTGHDRRRAGTPATPRQLCSADPDQLPDPCGKHLAGAHRRDRRRAPASPMPSFSPAAPVWLTRFGARGIGHGDTVAIMAANSPALLEAHYAAPMLGAVLNPINTRLDGGTIAFCLNHGKAKLLLADTDFEETIAPRARTARAWSACCGDFRTRCGRSQGPWDRDL